MTVDLLSLDVLRRNTQMLEDLSFDTSNENLVLAGVFTGVGFTMGMSCFLLHCLRRKCRKRKRRRPIIKVLGDVDADDDSTSSGADMTPEPVSDMSSDEEDSEVAVEIPEETEGQSSAPPKLYFGKAK